MFGQVSSVEDEAGGCWRERGASTTVKLMQMDHCVRIAWEFFSGWISVV